MTELDEATLSRLPSDIAAPPYDRPNSSAESPVTRPRRTTHPLGDLMWPSFPTEIAYQYDPPEEMQ
jgi:hypothetical protein